MTFLVPFDGTPLAESALVRAMEFAAALEEDVTVASVVPAGNERFARERVGLGPADDRSPEAVAAALHDRVAELAPAAEFVYDVVDRYAPTGTVANRLRRRARRVDASMVFVGSDDAGRVVSALSSVGRSMMAGEGYDVTIVRRERPDVVSAVAAATEREKERLTVYEDV